MGPLSWIGLIVLGIALHWTINLTFTNNPAFRTTNAHFGSQFGMRSWPQYVLYVVAWLLILIGTVWPITVISYGWGVLSLLILGMIVHHHRQREAQSLLWLLGIAMEKQMPVHPMARAFARERCDEVGARANRLADLLEQGMSLENALAETRYRLPAQAQLAINMNASMPSTGTSATGRLLHDTARQRFQVDTATHPYMQQMFYLTTVLIVGVFVLTFLAFKVFPAINQILMDFNLPRNSLYGLAMALVNTVASQVWISSASAVLFIALAVGLGLHYIGWITWEPLFIRRLTRRYHAAVVLRSLASQVNSAVPIHTSLEMMSKQYPRKHIQDRLQSAAMRVSRGEAWQEAMCTANLIARSDASVLRAAEKVGNLPWALEETANGIVRRLQYRVMLWMRVVIPVVIVAISLVVGLCGAAIFSSLVDIVMSEVP